MPIHNTDAKLIFWHSWHNVNQCSGSTCFRAFRILLSLSKNSKKNLDSYCFVTSFGLFLFEKWCKCTVPSKSIVISRKTFFKLVFCWRLEGQWRKYQDPDPDSHQNVMDPEHCGKLWKSHVFQNAGDYHHGRECGAGLRDRVGPSQARRHSHTRLQVESPLFSFRLLLMRTSVSDPGFGLDPDSIRTVDLSVSGSRFGIRIRIQNRNPEPDPRGRKWRTKIREN